MERIKFLVPALPITAVFCGLVLLPLSISAELTHGDELTIAYNVFLMVLFVALIIVMTSVSVRLKQLLKDAVKFHQQHSSKQSTTAILLNKLSWYIIVMDGMLVCSVVSLVVYLILEAQYHKWSFLFVHLSYRCEEFLLVFCTLMFLRKKSEETRDRRQTVRLTTIDNGGAKQEEPDTVEQ